MTTVMARTAPTMTERTGAVLRLIRFTWGSRASWERKPDVHEIVSVGSTSRFDGRVPARNVGYEDSVRRAPAIEAMATPPTSPMRMAMAR